MQRFWDKVLIGRAEECWPWNANRTDRGYGVFWVDGKTVRAHRFALMDAKGKPSAPSLKALHSCDNPPCCNPNHLRWGTTQDNSNDMVLRKRSLAGEKSWHAQISESDASKILRMRVKGMKCDEIASEMGLARDLVMNIYIGRAWSHLHGVDGNPTLSELKASKPKNRAKAHNRVLTEEMIDFIFQGRIVGKTCPEIAAELGLPVGTVSPVFSGHAFTERLGRFGNPTREELLSVKAPPKRSLTDDEIEEVILLLKEGFTGASIAEKYKVGKATISRINTSIKRGG